jgi:phosphatidylinositol alpha-1,6-mannosyltransferase
LGLEQEGFGIVFLEAAACGVPQVAGRSGGAAEAVVDGQTGLVVDEPGDVGQVSAALRRLLADGSLRAAMGAAGRIRAERSFGYGLLAGRLAAALADVEG